MNNQPTFADTWEETNGLIIGTFKTEPMPAMIAVSAPSYPEQFKPSLMAQVPMRWIRHANRLSPQQASDYLRRKLRTGNVGRKLRRYLRRTK